MSEDFVIGDRLRIQILSSTLVRAEEVGPKGFEDRVSFHIAEREWEGVSTSRIDTEDLVELATDSFRVKVLTANPTLQGVRIEDVNGALLFDGHTPVSTKIFLPDPAEPLAAWAFCDEPRIVPPKWGALPPPAGAASATSGWDLENQAHDVFVFLPGAGGYQKLLSDFLRLTGRVPLPPLAAFGLIDSRYYPYTQAEALAVVDTYRRFKIPLDIFVLDTDWRVGASHGYGINTDLIPDMAQFVRDAHARGVRVMLNDHPEPKNSAALSPEELRYRFDGLTSLLKLGVDYWWFDRNWHVSLGEPAPGLSKEVWGMRLYHDIAQAHRPDERVLVMSNVEGIDNGALNSAPSPAAHRFPIWWTGDTSAAWLDLRRGVQNALNSGARALLPYVSEDLGGHHDTPDEELYARFVQFGALSPICRLHCSANLTRHPWRYGVGGEIAADYIRLRYRLLPTLYSAARRAFDSGMPLLRRCDLDWPGHPEAKDDTQYLFGDDLLVAPIVDSVVPLRPIPQERLRSRAGLRGLDAEYFDNLEFEGEPAVRRVDENLCFMWPNKSPDPKLEPRKFSARWAGELGAIEKSGEYRIALRTNGHIRLWLNDDLLIDDSDHAGPIHKSADVHLSAGHRYTLRVEYRPSNAWLGVCELLWGRHGPSVAERDVWLPPGEWYDVWTAQLLEGPATVRVSAALARMPMFVRAGGLLFSIPPRASSGEAKWPELTVDWFLRPRSGSATRELYEDDGHSRAYLGDAFRKSAVTVETREGEHLFSIKPLAGALEEATRSITLRVHGLGRPPMEILVDGEPVKKALWLQTSQRIPLAGLAVRGSSEPSPLLEIKLDARSASAHRTVLIRV